MSELCVFKEFTGGAGGGAGSVIHPSGRQIVLVAVQGDPCDAGTIGKSFMQQIGRFGKRAAFDLPALLDEWKRTIGTNPEQVDVALVTSDRQVVHLDVHGAFRLYRLSDAQGPVLEQEFLAGETVKENASLADFSSYLITSREISQQAVENGGIRAGRLAASQIRRYLEPYDHEQRVWVATVFPVDAQFDLVSPEWPWNPLMGETEERRHERLGIRRIVDGLFSHPWFSDSRRGYFRIVPAPAALRPNSSREFDGLLVSTLGVFLLELKDHHGMIKVHAGASTGGASLELTDTGDQAGDPLGNLRAGIRHLQEHEALSSIDRVEARRLGALVFTHDNARVSCIMEDGSQRELPCQIGEVLVCRPSELPDLILRYAKSFLGKRMKRLALDPEQVEQICKSLVAPAATSQVLSFGDDVRIFLDREIPPESTQYFKVFTASYNGEDCIAKRFDLSPLAVGPREGEKSRLAREVKILRSLNRHGVAGVPYCYEKLEKGSSVYILLAPHAKATLVDWLGNGPDFRQRLSLMRGVARILFEINQIDSSIVHRAIHPHNIRIDEEETPQLINFECCQLDTVATIGPRARRSMETAFLAPEASAAGSQLTHAADVFSYMLCLHFALTGEQLLHEDIAHLHSSARRRRGYVYQHFVRTMGLPADSAELWARSLHDNPDYRPYIGQVAEEIENWMKE